MDNVFVTDLRMHRRFDLKGSSQGRSTEKVAVDETTTLKDLDLDLSFHMPASWRALMHSSAGRGMKVGNRWRSTEKVAVDETATLKDLDLDLCFHMPASWRALMHRQIALDTAFLQRQPAAGGAFPPESPPPIHFNHSPILQIALDTAFLQRQRIMDYSLLLGVHFRPTNAALPPVTIAEGRPTQDGQSRPSSSSGAAVVDVMGAVESVAFDFLRILLIKGKGTHERHA
ncbi:unnamed protein product [Closterium sp. Naga37s-1]|nr:unnamed protein product [Closterium sp. Naga37s-1]